MSQPVRLISSHRVTREELKEMVVQVGGVLTSEHPYLGFLSHEMGSVWICEPFDLDPNDPELEESELHLLDVLRLLFGDDARSNIVLDISFNPGSQKLTVMFASACA